MLAVHRVALALLVFAATTSPGHANEPAPWFASVDAIGPGGILSGGQHALVVKADTELSGYPAVFAGWRVGIGDVADFGLEIGGVDTAFLGRIHFKLALFEADERETFVGLRTRLEFKRHKQSFGDAFRPLDDLGLVFAPELSVGFRFGDERRHILYVAAFYYFDVDFRSGYHTEHWILPLMVGYEHRFEGGFHLLFDAGIFFELFEPQTAGQPAPKLRLTFGYEF